MSICVIANLGLLHYENSYVFVKYDCSLSVYPEVLCRKVGIYLASVDIAK